MRMTLFRLFLLLQFSILSSNLLAAAEVPEADTVKIDSAIILPGGQNVPVRSLGVYAYTEKDDHAFHSYAGLNVLNTLRGHVPNLQIGANATYPAGGARSANTLLVIDGLPNGAGYAQYYNLNAFEFETINAISSGVGTSAYGSPGAYGAVFLQSKTGKDISRPLVDFNIFPSYVTGDPASDRWQLTNGLAFAQDFGPVDTRISLNTTYMPYHGNTMDSQSGLHFLKVNTGFDILPGLSARLILDGCYRKESSESRFRFFNQPMETKTDTEMQNVVANLMVRYQATEWLALSSQGSLGRIEHQVDTRSQINSFTNTEYHRSFINLFATAERNVSEKLGFTGFAGGQLEKKKAYAFRLSDNATNEMNAQFQTTSLLGGGGLFYDKYLFANARYRIDDYSTLSDSQQATWSLTSAFVFSEAFGIGNRSFNSGTLRIGYGKSYAPGSPDPAQSPFSFRDYDPRYTPLQPRTMLETGTDLSFFNERVKLHVTYFHDFEDLEISDGVIGGPPIPILLGELHQDSWEIVLSGKSIDNNNLSLTTTLTWANPAVYIESNSSGGGGSVMGNVNPDWYGGLLNQLAFKDFFLSCLVDVQRGGDSFLITPDGYRIYDNSNAELRDLSVGYRWRSVEAPVRNVRLALSGRNLWTIYDRDETVQYTFRQSVTSLSLTLGF
jgi:hypothetical protein